MNTRRRWILAIAAVSVLVAAMDTYVIVLALPAIMADVGIGIDQLQAATPIVSGFLLGYMVVMPLLGRLSDIYGRRPLLLLCLAVFAAGSLVTASATDLGSVVAGRALQGLGGGGLVPVTLALVADLWPAQAAQPAARGDRRRPGAGERPRPALRRVDPHDRVLADDLLAQPPVAGALALGLVASGRPGAPPADAPIPRARLDRVSLVLAGVALVAGGLAIAAPGSAPRQRHARRGVQRARAA